MVVGWGGVGGGGGFKNVIIRNLYPACFVGCGGGGGGVDLKFYCLENYEKKKKIRISSSETFTQHALSVQIDIDIWIVEISR